MTIPVPLALGEKREYLGDGLYAGRDQWGNVTLSTQRDVEHYVVLDPQHLAAFLAWIERGVTP